MPPASLPLDYLETESGYMVRKSFVFQCPGHREEVFQLLGQQCVSWAPKLDSNQGPAMLMIDRKVWRCVEFNSINFR